MISRILAIHMQSCFLVSNKAILCHSCCFVQRDFQHSSKYEFIAAHPIVLSSNLTPQGARWNLLQRCYRIRRHMHHLCSCSISLFLHNIMLIQRQEPLKTIS